MSQFAIFPYLGIVYSILDIYWIWNDIYFLLGNYWCMWRYHGTQGWQRGSTLCFCTLFMRRPFIQSFTAMKIEKKIANEIDYYIYRLIIHFLSIFFSGNIMDFFPHHITSQCSDVQLRMLHIQVCIYTLNWY